MKGLINYIIAILIVLLLWLIDLVDRSFGCESIQEETQSIVTLYDGNVLSTSELRLENGRVLVHTFLASGRDGWIHLDPAHRGLHGRPWL